MFAFVQQNKFSIIWAIIILILSSISGKTLDELPKFNIPHLDKIVHFGMYFLFSIILLYEKRSSKTPKTVLITIIALTGIAYGIFLEILQKYIFINRSFEINDIISNTTGMLLGIPVYKFFIEKWLNIKRLN